MRDKAAGLTQKLIMRMKYMRARVGCDLPSRYHSGLRAWGAMMLCKIAAIPAVFLISIVTSTNTLAAARLSDAQMVEQQIKTCRLVMQNEGNTSPSFRLCMGILSIYSKNFETDFCRVVLPESSDADEIQRCAYSLKSERDQRNSPVTR